MSVSNTIKRVYIVFAQHDDDEGDGEDDDDDDCDDDGNGWLN